MQVLLDRAHFSAGEIDGAAGSVTSVVAKAFQAQHSLPQTGDLNDIYDTLQQGQEATPTLIEYTILYDDVRGPFAPTPKNLMAQAKLPALNYQTPWEQLGEKFHCSPGLLRRLNSQQKLTPGTKIVVPNVHRDSPGKAASVVVSKSDRTVQALDSSGKAIAVYPATIGSQHDPLPVGNWKVTEIFWNPTFHYNPDLFWDARRSDGKALIRPGPNNPAGAVWIGINKPHYGLHGTPEPGAVGHLESHGCIRLTNWDATELGQMIEAGTPVRFQE